MTDGWKPEKKGNSIARAEDFRQAAEGRRADARAPQAAEIGASGRASKAEPDVVPLPRPPARQPRRQAIRRGRKRKPVPERGRVRRVLEMDCGPLKRGLRFTQAFTDSGRRRHF